MQNQLKKPYATVNNHSNILINNIDLAVCIYEYDKSNEWYKDMNYNLTE